MQKSVGILRHDYEGHAEDRIEEVCKDRGIKVQLINPFKVTLGVEPDTIRYDGTALALDGIVSRCEISDGLSPEAGAYLRVLDFYESRGLPVVNSSRSIVDCQDKFRAHSLISKAGLPTPKTYLTHSLDDALEIMAKGELQFPIVVKNPYGSRGIEVYKAKNVKDLRALYKEHFAPSSSFLLQQFLELERNNHDHVRDMRLWVVRNSDAPITLGAVYRNSRGGDFRTNVAQGSYLSPVENLGDDVKQLGVATLVAVGADVAGIDVARTVDEELFVEEVNTSLDTGPYTLELIKDDIWEHVIDLLVKRMGQE